MALNEFKNKTATGIGTSLVTIHTTPGSYSDIVIGFDICNTTGGTVLVDVQHVDTSLVTTVNVFKGKSLASGETLRVIEHQKIILEEGDIIKVKSDTAASLDVTFSYLETNNGLAGSGANLANDSYLTARNFVNSANIGLIKVDTNDDTILNSDTGNDIVIAPEGVRGWIFQGTGEMLPDVTNPNADIGASTSDATHVEDLYALSIERATAGGLSLKALDTITFYTNGSSRAFFNASDALLFVNNFLLGADTSDGADSQTISIAGGGAASITRGGYLTVYGNEHASGGAIDLVAGDTGNAHITLNANSTAGTLIFKTQNTSRWTINASSQGYLVGNQTANGLVSSATTGAIQIAGGTTLATSSGGLISVYGSTHATNSGQANISAGTGSGSTVTISAPATNGTVTVSTNGSNRWQVTASGHLEAQANNTLNIGSTSNYLLAAYVNTLISSGAMTFSTSGTNRWNFATTGHLLPVASATYNIGDSTHQVLSAFINTVEKCSAVQNDSGILELKTTGAFGMAFYTNNTSRFSISSAGVFTYTGASQTLVANTADAADTSSFTISGGGAVGTGRGGSIQVYGNDALTAQGLIQITAGTGDGSGNANVNLLCSGTSGTINLGTNATYRHQITAAGHFVPTANNTYNLGTSSTAEYSTVFARSFRCAATDVTLSTGNNIILSSGNSNISFRTQSGGTAESWNITGKNLLPTNNVDSDIGSISKFLLTTHTQNVRSNGTLTLYNAIAPSATITLDSTNIGLGNSGTGVIFLDTLTDNGGVLARNSKNTSGGSALVAEMLNSGSSGVVFKIIHQSIAGGFDLISGYRSAGADRIFNISGAGNAVLEGSWVTDGIGDYAEYFESADGEELPLGATVCFDSEGKLVLTDADTKKADVIGVVRSKVDSSGIVCNSADLNWQGKYIRDVFGVREIDSETGGYKLNPDYDPDVQYTPRSARPEWNLVALLGVIVILKGQKTATGWIKMRDLDDEHELWLIK